MTNGSCNAILNNEQAATYQLDGESRHIKDTYGMYQYYFQVRRVCKLIVPGYPTDRRLSIFFVLQVVPTRYRFLNGTTIQTNQYSVTEHLRHVNPGSGRG